MRVNAAGTLESDTLGKGVKAVLAIDIPGYKELRLAYMVLDYNGTLACDGELIDGVAERFPDPQVKKSVEADLEMITALNITLKKLESHIEKTARQHDYHTLYLLRSIPGVGEILALVILYEIHDIKRFPRVQNFSSYARLVKPVKESDGKW